ncbi:cAMP-specific 3',5'-cyclic phosphodiesterase 4A-like isoform X2 [Anthonomus grandis grandis]|nr:cAMP-specific 3',5'-cyclic phosphodiesterase 4A-like isoform X2 [Anthonomus grandis grandis]
MGTAPTPHTSGKFLTMHKRRRKKLTTRALSQDHAILDDIHHGLVQMILDRSSSWAFNAFTLETVAGGRSLPVLCVHLFHWYGLLDHFHLDVVRVWKLFTLIEEGYHSTNPYHNSIHATDVTQAMHCFLQEEQIRRHLTPLEIMASLIGAVAHDLDHPGVNQHFLITTSNHLAILYQNMSVLENHHWRSAVGCLLESGVAEQLLPHRSDLEQQIRDLILATDINRQQEFLTKFRRHIDEGTLDLRLPENRSFILQIALKCADISNPTRPWDISHKWSLKVCDEFFRQGEFERQLGLPVTSICDQQSTSVAKIQVGFFRFVVTPLFSEWHRFMHSDLSTHMIETLETNRKRWEDQERTEQAEETQTELSDAEPEISEDEEPTKRSSEASTSIHDFIPPPPAKETRRQSLAVPTLESLGVRRHSVPVHMEIPTVAAKGSSSPQRHQQPPLPRTIFRRESLPASTTIRVSQGRSPVSPQTESRASSGLREEDELLHYGSQSSVISSSGSPYHSSEENPDRPLSAENLLPEPSIASMTSNSAIRHLTAVLQSAADRATQATAGATAKCLTRQQTFPPPQPYMRVRYMSATAEMTTCPEGDSRSNSSYSSHENVSRGDTVQLLQQQQPASYTIPAIAVLSPNNSRPPDLLLPGETKTLGSNNNKRETEAASCAEKEKEKRVKLSESSGPFCEKENLDPRQIQGTGMSRRGSAPVFLALSKPDENSSSAGGGLTTADVHQALRRGSVPIEIARHFRSFDEDNGKEPTSGHIINITPVETNRTFWLYQRRGSAPVDLPPSGATRYEFVRHTSLNGKACRGRGKKQLRRRSSGGPETVSGGGAGAEPSGGGSDVLARFCAQLHRRVTPSESTDALLARRRGSLPLEVLTVGHSVF